MTAFNAFYYSFSPHVAAYISQHSLVRAGVRITLYPLMGILDVSSKIFELTRFNPEMAVTLSGIFAALGIGVVYVGPVTLLCQALRPRPASTISKITKLIFGNAASWFAILAIGYVLRQDTVHMVATSATVLSFLALGGFSVTYVMTRLARKNPE